MNYIVLDLEFNQTYDFNDGNPYEANPKCPFEIIQIGAVKLNSKFKIIEEFNVLVKPQVYKKIHPIVEKLTGLNDKTLANESSFQDAYSKFLNFIGSGNITLCVWGPYDIKALYKNIIFYNLSHEAIKPYFINVQSEASKFLKHPFGVSIGLKNAAISFKLELDKPFHNALNDAIYTAKILKKLKKESFIITKFNINQVNNEKKPVNKNQVNTTLLYKTIEKELGRKLTLKEKNMYRNVYLLGKKRVFDI